MSKIFHATKSGNSEIVIKKSIFIGHVEAVTSKEETALFLREERKKYFDAKHICYAYLIENGEQKFSDDGEPGGTAGRPMMDVITGKEATNVLVMVTRYFGGVLLGTGGLVRAYTEAAKLALEDAGLKEVRLQSRLFIQVPYADWGTIQYILQQAEVESMKEEYGADVCTEIRLPVEKEKALADAIREKTAARVMVEKIGEEIA